MRKFFYLSMGSLVNLVLPVRLPQLDLSEDCRGCLLHYEAAGDKRCRAEKGPASRHEVHGNG